MRRKTYASDLTGAQLTGAFNFLNTLLRHQALE